MSSYSGRLRQLISLVASPHHIAPDMPRRRASLLNYLAQPSWTDLILKGALRLSGISTELDVRDLATTATNG